MGIIKNFCNLLYINTLQTMIVGVDITECVFFIYIGGNFCKRASPNVLRWRRCMPLRSTTLCTSQTMPSLLLTSDRWSSSKKFSFLLNYPELVWSLNLSERIGFISQDKTGLEITWIMLIKSSFFKHLLHSSNTLHILVFAFFIILSIIWAYVLKLFFVFLCISCDL